MATPPVKGSGKAAKKPCAKGACKTPVRGMGKAAPKPKK